MHVPGGPAVRGDRGRPRRDQRRDLLQRPAQRARRHVQPVGGQRLHDPVHRPAQHMLLIRQPRQEPRGEQALRHRPGRHGRADRRRSPMRTPPPVTPPPPHDPGDLHPPVDLLAVLGPDELERLPAHRAAPLASIHIDDPLLGLQMRIVPPPVTRPARPLPPLTRAARPIAALPPGPACRRAALLRRRPEQQPAQRRHALLQPVHLPGQLRHPRGQPGILRPQLRHQRLGPPGAGTPVTGINILIDHRRRHATQHTSPHQPRHAPNPACRDPGEPAPRDHRLLTCGLTIFGRGLWTFVSSFTRRAGGAPRRDGFGQVVNRVAVGLGHRVDQGCSPRRYDGQIQIGI